MKLLRNTAIKYLSPRDVGGRNIKELPVVKTDIEGDYVEILKVPRPKASLLKGDRVKIVSFVTCAQRTIQAWTRIGELKTLGDRLVCLLEYRVTNSREIQAVRTLFKGLITVILVKDTEDSLVGQEAIYVDTVDIRVRKVSTRDIADGLFDHFVGVTFEEGVESFLEMREEEEEKIHLLADIMNLKRLLQERKDSLKSLSVRKIEHECAQAFHAKKIKDGLHVEIRLSQIMGVCDGQVELVKDIDYTMFVKVDLTENKVYVASTREEEKYPHPHCQGSAPRYRGRRYYKACLGQALSSLSYFKEGNYTKGLEILVQFLGQADLRDTWGKYLRTEW